MDARPAVVTPFERAQAGLERQLLAAKRARAEADFRQSLRAAARVRTDSQLLSRVDYPTQAVAQAASATPPPPPDSR